MLLWLLSWLYGRVPDEIHVADLGALGKTTLRAALAALASFAAALVLGPRLIQWLGRRFPEPIASPSPRLQELHQHKQATPTMGGLFVVAGLIAALLIFGDLGNHYVPIMLLLLIGLTAVGAVDDLRKLSAGGGGLRPRVKLAAQTAVAFVAAVLLYGVESRQPGGLELFVPLVGPVGDLGIWFIPLAVIVIVGSSNAVNLTDGLDGLAGGCLLSTLAALGVVAYASGQAGWATYMSVAHIPGAGELVVVAAAAIGGTLGFLWFNCHPAQVFLGNTGSLPLGGALGLMAVMVRQELWLVLAGGVFVAEAGSVILQVGAYRWRQRRVLLCAPLHHHFQFLSWPEGKIVVRFWIASVLCAVLGLAMLKSRPADNSTPAELEARRTPAAVMSR
jgi:phospho-N-acetylmuramoyl-pentapeptide-transferase